jgi:hypothetical protein
MSQQFNEYGSIALGYESDRTASAPSSPRSAGHHAEEEEVVAVVAQPPKKTIKPKTAPKKTKTAPKKKTEDAVAEEEEVVVAEVVVAEVVVASPPSSPPREVVAEVVAEVADVETMSFLQKMIDEAVAPLALRLKAIEDAEDNQPLGEKPKRKGYYTVADGDEELCRVRLQNKELRKEIDAKAETNRKLSDQLLGDEGSEVVRLKAMNLALRKERDGARQGRKDAIAQAEKYRQMLIDAGIALE